MRLTQQGFTEEQFRWCFWGPTGSGGPESDAANAGGFGGGPSGGDGADRDAGRSGPSAGDSGRGGGRDDRGFDAGGYVSSAISDFASNAGVPTGPSGSGDRDRDGIPDSIDIDGGSGSGRAARGVSAPSVSRGAVSRGAAPSIAPNFVNQPLSVGGAFAMPYDAYQRSPQQMFGYGGLTASPYSPSAISFQGGQAARSFDPLGGEALSVFDVGRSPQDYANRGFFDRIAEGIGGRFGAPFVEQRAGFYDPMSGTFRNIEGTNTNTLEKVSENPLRDAFGNFVASKFGSTMNSADYMPLTGGEMYQYSEAGGLLGLLAGEPTMVPYSEIEARMDAMNREKGGGGGDAPLIIPQEVAEIDEETGEPVAFPDFTPREFEYQPFTSQFYTIPSRFTQPYGLLG